MNSNKYYLPVNSANIAHYFSKGCICPTRYIQNRNIDIQNKFENFILLADDKFTDVTNCSLEIVLNDKFEKVNQISENFYLLDIPIAISRVKKIYFQEKSQKVTTIFNVISGAAFIPEALIEVDLTSQPINSQQLYSISSPIYKNEWNKQLDIFDRLMGGFAMISRAGEQFQNYPLSYFQTLAVINDLVREQLTSQSIETKSKYEWAILGNDKFEDLYYAIYSKISNDVVDSFALKEGIKVEKINGNYVLENIKESYITYVIAILANYGEGARKSIDNFISDFVSNKFLYEKKEPIALIFGINKGYEGFRNKYKTTNFELDIKFKLDSKLDYYTIESIYQFAFHKKKNNYSFDYIDSWCANYIEQIISGNYETYKIIDRTIILKKKEKTGFQNFLQNLFQNTSRNKIYEKIVSEISKCIPLYVKEKDVNEGKKHFMSLLEKDFEEYTMTIFDKVKEYIESDVNIKFSKLENEKKSEIEKLNNNIQTLKIRINELEANLQNPIQNEDKVKNISELNDEKITDDSAIELNSEKKAHSINPVLFPLDYIENTKIGINRKFELEKLGITKLKEIAKEYGIKDLNKYKSNPTDIEMLITKILLFENQQH